MINTRGPTLQAFIDSFCQTEFVIMPEGGALGRERLKSSLALYSNNFGDPGVISSEDGKYPDVPDAQLDTCEERSLG
jgi:hypothetical protein